MLRSVIMTLCLGSVALTAHAAQHCPQTNGACVPKTNTYAWYPTRWRKWPEPPPHHKKPKSAEPTPAEPTPSEPTPAETTPAESAEPKPTPAADLPHETGEELPDGRRDQDDAPPPGGAETPTPAEVPTGPTSPTPDVTPELEQPTAPTPSSEGEPNAIREVPQSGSAEPTDVPGLQPLPETDPFQDDQIPDNTGQPSSASDKSAMYDAEQDTSRIGWRSHARARAAGKMEIVQDVAEPRLLVAPSESVNETAKPLPSDRLNPLRRSESPKRIGATGNVVRTSSFVEVTGNTLRPALRSNPLRVQ